MWGLEKGLKILEQLGNFVLNNMEQLWITYRDVKSQSPDLPCWQALVDWVNDLLSRLCAGLIKETMVNTLHVLRNSQQVLLAAMAVFTQEPSLDWLKVAKQTDNGKAVPYHKLHEVNR